MEHSCLPMINDAVAWWVVWAVIWCSFAGLHKQLGVVDCRDGFYLHENPAPYVILQRVWIWINRGLELAVRIELKLVGECAEAFLPHRDIFPVCQEASWHLSMLGVHTAELHFQQVFPGDQSTYVVDCSDFILENDVFLVFLQSKRLCCRHTAKENQHQWLKEEHLKTNETNGPVLPRSQCHKHWGGWRR